MKRESAFRSAINAYKKQFVNNWADFMGQTPEAALANINEVKNTLIGIGLVGIGIMSVNIPALVLGAGIGAGWFFHKALTYNQTKNDLMQSQKALVTG